MPGSANTPAPTIELTQSATTSNRPRPRCSPGDPTESSWNSSRGRRRTQGVAAATFSPPASDSTRHSPSTFAQVVANEPWMAGFLPSPSGSIDEAAVLDGHVAVAGDADLVRRPADDRIRVLLDVRFHTGLDRCRALVGLVVGNQRCRRARTSWSRSRPRPSSWRSSSTRRSGCGSPVPRRPGRPPAPRVRRAASALGSSFFAQPVARSAAARVNASNVRVDMGPPRFVYWPR